MSNEHQHTNLPKGHPEVKMGNVGVLLVNLGTVSELTVKSVRKYLRQFLSDKRVIEAPSWFWKPILNLIILNTRPKKTLANYAKVWDEASNRSPLLKYTADQATALQEAVGSRYMVDFAMRYGSPSIMDKLSALKEKGCDRVVVVPMYPQYSATTTAAVYDDVFASMKKMRWLPTVRFTPPFHDHPAYIQALTTSMQRTLAELDWVPDAVLTSFHGLPQAYFDKGDPYHCYCHKTSRLLKESMAFEGSWVTAFQSRFGPKQWLKPYASESLKELAQSGKKKVVVIAPSFVTDCIETLEEIAMELKDEFLEAGGESFAYVPCLNASPESVQFFQAFIDNEVQGWVS